MTSGSFGRRRASLRPSCVVLQTAVVASACLSFVSGKPWSVLSSIFPYCQGTEPRVDLLTAHRPLLETHRALFQIYPWQELLPEEKPAAGPQTQASTLHARTGLAPDMRDCLKDMPPVPFGMTLQQEHTA